MKYPLKITWGSQTFFIESHGWLLKFLRVNFYRQFRKMHISGYKDCPTWESLLEKLSREHGFTIEQAQQVTP